MREAYSVDVRMSLVDDVEVIVAEQHSDLSVLNAAKYMRYCILFFLSSSTFLLLLSTPQISLTDAIVQQQQ